MDKETPDAGTPIITKDDEARWEEESNFVDPAQSTPEPEAEEETPKEVETEEPLEEEVQQPSEPVATLADPGEFTPRDYSFEVTVYDDEGKKPKTRKITSVDEWESLLDEDPNLGSPSALLKAQRLVTKMESAQERDKAEWEKTKQAYDLQAEEQQSRNEKLNEIQSGVNYLVSAGKLPKVAKEFEAADWSDPNVAKQPGVKETVELLQYMNKENAARKKAGFNAEMSIVDAYNAMQLDKKYEDEKNTRKAAGEARKAAGARVAGNSPVPVSNVPRGIAVGRGGSLRDLDSSW